MPYAGTSKPQEGCSRQPHQRNAPACRMTPPSTQLVPAITRRSIRRPRQLGSGCGMTRLILPPPSLWTGLRQSYARRQKLRLRHGARIPPPPRRSKASRSTRRCRQRIASPIDRKAPAAKAFAFCLDGKPVIHISCVKCAGHHRMCCRQDSSFRELNLPYGFVLSPLAHELRSEQGLSTAMRKKYGKTADPDEFSPSDGAGNDGVGTRLSNGNGPGT